MTHLIWLTDLHFASDGPVCGINTQTRVKAAIDYANAHYSDAAGCVISGDLVNRGTEQDYRCLRDVLQTLKMPVFPMVGNHDDRSLVRKHLPLPDTAMRDFIQYSVEIDGHLVLCLDTQMPGADAGEFCAARAHWLDRTLTAAKAKSVVAFVHHPPLTLGLPMQDLDYLKDGDTFIAQLRKSETAAYLCCGHVHRPVTGVVHGVPFATLRSCTFQAPAPRPDWTWDTFEPAEEAPQLGVIDLTNTGVTIQYHDICAPSFGLEKNT